MKRHVNYNLASVTKMNISSSISISLLYYSVSNPETETQKR